MFKIVMVWKQSLVLQFMLLTLVYLASIGLCHGSSLSPYICREAEKKALLEFKEGLKDPASHLSSWSGQDCCAWRGVQCDNQTGHVVRLDLRAKEPILSETFGTLLDVEQPLGGEISPSLLGLKHLTYLDLSINNFGGTHIPSFFGSLQSLRYLNLSRAGFSGPIPHQLGNLSNLHYLDLSGNNIFVHGSHWLANLSSLQCLNLNSVDFSKATHWLESLNTLTSLTELHLSDCNLQVIPLALPRVNFTNLHVLDLSSNLVDSVVPIWLFKLSSLEYLDLSHNSFQDLIPDAIGNLTSLRVLNLAYVRYLTGGIPVTLGNLCKLSTLDLSTNDFPDGDLSKLSEVFSGCIKNSLETFVWQYQVHTGYLPTWLRNLKALKILDLTSNRFYGPVPDFQLPSLLELHLGDNRLNGTVPQHFGQLFPKLIVLDLFANNISGVLTEQHFASLRKIEYLDLSDNVMELRTNSGWIPPPRLKTVNLGSFKLGPKFPTWLQNLKNISSFSMSNAGFIELPDWFWNFSMTMEYVDVSHNSIRSKIPSSLEHLNLKYLDLSHNYFEGPLPLFSSKVECLELENNSFSGFIRPNISSMVPNLVILSVSSNSLTGTIPESLCQLKHLGELDLSNNKITGPIPDCWNRILDSTMGVMDLSYNNLSGHIPSSVCSPSLLSLHLSNNGLTGGLPLSFKDCTGLMTLDLGNNKLNGSIPAWLGENLLQLVILRLSSNMFIGNIPLQFGSLKHLQLIDLANNHLSGSIPHTFGKLSAMKVHPYTYNNIILNYVDNIKVNIKGREARYDEELLLLIYIDLSNNELSGEIPEELGSLSYLEGLNLAMNHLEGKIPEKISELRWLEALDLSMNNLSGVIPPVMTNLTSLDHLNLSYNNLRGEIPHGDQFQTLLDPTIYVGNEALCGFPLDTKCETSEASQPPRASLSSDNEHEVERIWFYLSVALGFIFGFWAVCGSFMLKRNWRFAYFRFVDSIYDKVYVIVVVNLTRMSKKCGYGSE